MQEKAKNPIILVPTRKSYVDLPLLGYIFFAYGLKQPFFSVPIDYKEVKILNRIFQLWGASYVQEKNKKPLYNAVLDAYISIVMGDNQTISVWIEESREKFGMMVKPNPKVFNSALKSFFEGRAKDIDIIPITINYDRILEGETFPYELVGEESVKISLSRFISSTRYIGTPFGKCCINFGTKISAKQYFGSLGLNQNDIRNLPHENRNDIISGLIEKVMRSLMENTVIMSTGPISSVLLQYRRGISNESLVSHIEWVYKELDARKAKVSEASMLNRGTSNSMILLNKFVKKNKDVFEPSVSPKIDYKNILMLAYYKNTLAHIFLKEMIIGKLFLKI